MLYFQFDKNRKREIHPDFFPCFHLKSNPKIGLKSTKIASFRHFSVSFYTSKKSHILPQKRHSPPITNHKTGRSGSIFINLNREFNS